MSSFLLNTAWLPWLLIIGGLVWLVLTNKTILGYLNRLIPPLSLTRPIPVPPAGETHSPMSYLELEKCACWLESVGLSDLATDVAVKGFPALLNEHSKSHSRENT